jgi:transposase
MDLGPFLIETHLKTGRPIAELASSHDVHRSWLYKLLKRYRLEGPGGLQARSRRPHRSPSRIVDRYEDEIVSMRKELLDIGVDAGAETIRYHLQKRHSEAVPSVSSIWRVLKARGFVTPQPQKRPKSSYRTFCADLPNEMWQSDMTHFTIATGEVLEILNMLDDHSRLCVASRAFVITRAPDVVRTFYKAAETLGFPQSVLTDNGLIFTSVSARVRRCVRDGARRLGHSLQAQPSLPSADLRKGREVPPDLEEVPLFARPDLYEEAAAGLSRSLRPLLQRGPSSPRHRAQNPSRGLRSEREGPA